MVSNLQEFFRKNYIRPFVQAGIHILTVEDSEIGAKRVEEILTEVMDNKTALFLSGGKTPKLLYQNLAREQTITAAAVGMIDERFGPKGHTTSNERMIHETGFLNFLTREGISFYPILKSDEKPREETAQEYDETARYLLMNIPKSVAILGLGKDGHTAGIAPNRKPSLSGAAFKNPLFETYNNGLVVSEFNDTEGPFGERITFTFHGLSMIDLLIVLVFGRDKQHAFDQVFTKGTEQEIPGRFYTRANIAPKTLFITDAKV